MSIEADISWDVARLAREQAYVRRSFWSKLRRFAAALPFDIVPDMMPMLGFTDDAAVLATALKLVASHMRPEHRDAAKAAIARGLAET